MIEKEPWLVKEAIAFIDRFLELKQGEGVILEFGSGNSTLWFAKRGKQVITVEQSKNWADKLKQIIKNEGLKNIDIYLREGENYADCSLFSKEAFDLVLVDGKNRKQILKQIDFYLKRGGLLVLDDSARKKYRSDIERFSSWEHHSAKESIPKSIFYKQTDWWIKP